LALADRLAWSLRRIEAIPLDVSLHGELSEAYLTQGREKDSMEELALALHLAGDDKSKNGQRASSSLALEIEASLEQNVSLRPIITCKSPAGIGRGKLLRLSSPATRMGTLRP
jgi:hypothetical protein